MALRLHRFLLLPVVLALPLLLGQCSGKQTPDSMRKELMKRENALATADAEWDKKQAQAQRGGKSMPLERLEALGEMSLRSRDYETSLINFLEILKDNPARYDLRYKVGVIYFLNGQLEAARKELALVLVQRPQMLQAHEALGLVHLEEKKICPGHRRISTGAEPGPQTGQSPPSFGRRLPGGGTAPAGRLPIQSGLGLGAQ
jgi:tetratricopeptide (TPR) repeat protein